MTRPALAPRPASRVISLQQCACLLLHCIELTNCVPLCSENCATCVTGHTSTLDHLAPLQIRPVSKCLGTTPTVCPNACVGSQTWSYSGMAPCLSCSPCPAGTHPVKVCSAMSDTVCSGARLPLVCPSTADSSVVKLQPLNGPPRDVLCTDGFGLAWSFTGTAPANRYSCAMFFFLFRCISVSAYVFRETQSS